MANSLAQLRIATLIFIVLVVGKIPLSAQIVSHQADPETRPNVLLICVDDLRPELNCFGKSYIQSPNIDGLAKTGCSFDRHYVQAPTCGASRFAMLMGRYGPTSNNAFFQVQNAREKTKPKYLGLPRLLRDQGYTSVSVGKVSHHPGGLGGPDWNDPGKRELPGAWTRQLMPSGPWKHPRGAMHGLANGEIRIDASKMDVFQSVEGDDQIYPDGLICDEAILQLEELAAQEAPFFLAVGLIRPHLPFGAPLKYRQLYDNVALPPVPHPARPDGRTTWHRSGEFMRYNRQGKDPNLDPEFSVDVRKHYAACVSYADAQVGKLIAKLRQLKLTDKTVVVLWGDHGWHLGEHAIWGKHSLFEESLRSPLIIVYPKLSRPGEISSQIVESIDIYPTLCELLQIKVPSSVRGESLVPIMEGKVNAAGEACSYAAAKTIRTATHRLIEHSDGYVELYDHRVDGDETVNVADSNSALVDELRKKLKQRLQ